jgi:hypothetical protein
VSDTIIPVCSIFVAPTDQEYEAHVNNGESPVTVKRDEIESSALRSKYPAATGKLHDLVRQFGLRHPSVDHLSDYLADQVRNRDARSFGRLSKTAHPFLIERIDRITGQAELHKVLGRLHVFLSFIVSSSECAGQSSRKLAHQWQGLGSGGNI